MSPSRRILLLISIMVASCLAVGAAAVTVLYRAAIAQQRERLVETVRSQARLIEAISRFDSQFSREYPGGAREATLTQITDAHDHYQGFGKTGEFTLSRREGDNMVFLLSHRYADSEKPKPIPLQSGLAEPMRLQQSFCS